MMGVIPVCWVDPVAGKPNRFEVEEVLYSPRPISANSTHDSSDAMIVEEVGEMDDDFIVSTNDMGEVHRVVNRREFCAICFEEDNPQPLVSLCNGCEHRYCTSCIIKYAKNACMSQLYSMNLRCPHPGCGAKATRHEVMAVTGIDEADLMNFNNPMTRKCSNATCGSVLAIQFNSPCLTCEKCKTRTCVKCSRAWHGINTSCFEDIRNNKWMQHHNVGFCPHCFALIEKNGGCPHMQCMSCGKGFQWEEQAPKQRRQAGSNLLSNSVRGAVNLWGRIYRGSAATVTAVTVGVVAVVVVPARTVSRSLERGSNRVQDWVTERELRNGTRVVKFMKAQQRYRERGVFGPVDHAHL